MPHAASFFAYPVPRSSLSFFLRSTTTAAVPMSCSYTSLSVTLLPYSFPVMFRAFFFFSQYYRYLPRVTPFQLRFLCHTSMCNTALSNDTTVPHCPSSIVPTTSSPLRSHPSLLRAPSFMHVVPSVHVLWSSSFFTQFRASLQIRVRRGRTQEVWASITQYMFASMYILSSSVAR